LSSSAAETKGEAGPRALDRLDCGARVATGDDRSARGTLDRSAGASDFDSVELLGNPSPVVGDSTYVVVVVVAVGSGAGADTVGVLTVCVGRTEAGSSGNAGRLTRSGVRARLGTR
jgi:hypothetical protein